MLKENNMRLRFLAEDEIPVLLENCKGHLRDIVETAIHTGMRRGEILSLKWSQIRNGFIYLRKTKTNNSRQIPINNTLEALFDRLKGNSTKVRYLKSKTKSPYVFSYKGNRIKEVKTSFSTALRDAEIEDFHFHDLRHTFASQLLLKGGTLKDVQELLGHKDIKMTMRYAHLTQEHKRKAVNLLNKLTAPTPRKATCHKSVTNSNRPNFNVA